MGYYMGGMGDFYGGYRGDPGWLGSVWSGLKRVAAPAIGLLPGGGTVTAITKAAAGFAAKHPTLAKVGRGAIAVVSKHPAISAAATAGAAVTAAGAVHMARRGSSAAAGMAAGPAAGAGGGFGGGRKRMNVCNPRALRRAIRRTHGFAKLAMKTIHLVHPTKHARFGGFKRVKHAPRRKRRA